MKKIKKLKFENADDIAERKKKHSIGVPNIPAIQKYFSSRQNTFTKSMKNISNAIIRHPDILKNNLLINFSKNLDLGEASVMRFCKHLGFRGFTEFKKYFIEEFFDIPDEQDNKSQIFDLGLNEKTQPSELLTKLSNLVARITLETKQGLALSNQEIIEAQEHISECNHLFIFGPSTSRQIIEETAARFTNIGITTLWATDVNDMVSKASLLKKGDVAIAVSSSGYNVEVLKVVSQIQKHRVYTIGITCDNRSELYIMADASFQSYGQTEADNHSIQESIYLRISQMFIFETLISLIKARNSLHSQEHMLSAKSTIEQINQSDKPDPTIV